MANTRIIGVVRVVFPALLASLLAACASSYQVVQMPQREADMYPLSQAKAGVTIAIDEIRSAARTERFFGANLIKAGILPVNVVVSNYGKHRVVVKPSDILLQRNKEVVDPLPLEIVVAAAKREHPHLRAKTQQPVEQFFDNLTFKETVLMPNDTYHGIMFFASPRPKRDADTFFTQLSVFRDGGPKMRVAVTDLDSSERVHFGPFTLTPSDTASLFSYPSY